MKRLELDGGRLGISNAGGELDLPQQLRAPLRFRGQALLELGLAILVHKQTPHAAEEAINALDAFGVPRLHHLQRPHEHLVKTKRVGAVLPEDEPLIDEPVKGLRCGDVPQVEKHLVPEPGIKQVQHRVLGAADV